MRKILILWALVAVTVSTTGCSRCRNLFRRGSPCFGTRTAAPAMIGRPLAIGAPIVTPAPSPVVQQVVVPQASSCCEQPAICYPCDPCQSPCETDCGCGPTVSYDSGIIESGTPVIQGGVITEGSGSRADPGPVGQ